MNSIRKDAKSMLMPEQRTRNPTKALHLSTDLAMLQVEILHRQQYLLAVDRLVVPQLYLDGVVNKTGQDVVDLHDPLLGIGLQLIVGLRKQD